MESDRDLKIAAALTDSMVVATIFMNAFSAMLRELSQSGALDQQQLQRIAGYLETSVDQSFASRELRAALNGLMAQHFSELTGATIPAND